MGGRYSLLRRARSVMLPVKEDFKRYTFIADSNGD